MSQDDFSTLKNKDWGFWDSYSFSFVYKYVSYKSVRRYEVISKNAK